MPGFQTSVQGPGLESVIETAAVPGFATAPALELVSGGMCHGQMMLWMSAAVPVVGWMVCVSEKV